MEEREVAKAYLDGVGHYSRPDLLNLQIREEAWTAAATPETQDTARQHSAAHQMLDMLERDQITPEELESILAGRG
jgi:hypothetical protein